MSIPTPPSAATVLGAIGAKLLTLTIYSLDDGPLTTIKAQYNPKEVQIDRTVPWNKHAGHKAGEPDLEFTASEARSMQLELFFDEFENELDVDKMYVRILERMATPTTLEKRPHLLEVAWGTVFKKPFRCVIASLSVKYTMFTPIGVPVRATVNVKLTEASNPVFKAAKP